MLCGCDPPSFFIPNQSPAPSPRLAKTPQTRKLKELVWAEVQRAEQRSVQPTSTSLETPASEMDALRRCVLDGADIVARIRHCSLLRSVLFLALRFASLPFINVLLLTPHRVEFTEHICAVCFRESCEDAAAALLLVLNRVKSHESDLLYVYVNRMLLAFAAPTGMLTTLWPVVKRYFYIDPHPAFQESPVNLWPLAFQYDWDAVDAADQRRYFNAHGAFIMPYSRSTALLLRGTYFGTEWDNTALVERCMRDGANLSAHVPHGYDATLLHFLLQYGSPECVCAVLQTTAPLDFSKRDDRCNLAIEYVFFRCDEQYDVVLKAVVARIVGHPEDTVSFECKDRDGQHFLCSAADKDVLSVVFPIMKELPYFQDSGKPFKLCRRAKRSDWDALSEEDKEFFETPSFR